MFLRDTLNRLFYKSLMDFFYITKKLKDERVSILFQQRKIAHFVWVTNETVEFLMLHYYEITSRVSQGKKSSSYKKYQFKKFKCMINTHTEI